MTFSNGRSLLVQHDLDTNEMVQALVALSRAQRIDDEIVARLAKSEAPSPEPEAFMRGIVERIDAVYRETMATLMQNLDRWFKTQVDRELFKAMNRPPLYLTQSQVDELVELIRAHFRAVVRIGRDFAVSPDYERRWKQAGIVAPNVYVGAYVRDAYVAGKLHDVLTSHSTYEEMRFAARGAQLTRAEQLMLDAVQRDVALWFMQPVNRLADEAALDIQRQNNAVVRGLVGRYMAGTLPPTPPNLVGLTPAEVEATQQPGVVQGWKQLARELRNRMASIDAGRDWQRVAATETRYAYNAGRLLSFAERGVQEVEWQVQPDACPYCKELLLNPDGSRRHFAMSFIRDVLARTDGSNYGRRASRIGREGGWLPTTIIHPWCRCTPFPVGVLA